MAAALPLILQRGSGSNLSLHPHHNLGLEVVQVNRGTLIWQVEGRTEVVKPGSVFFTLPWQRHGSVLEFEPGHHWNYFVLRLEKKDPLRPGPFTLPEEMGFTSSESRKIAAMLRQQTDHTFPGTPEMAAAISRLAEAPPSAGPWQARREIALAALVLVGLTELIERGAAGKPESMDSRRVARVIDRLRMDPAKPWSLPEATQLAGLQKSRFCELFLHETGDTFIDFINRLRIERSRELLQRSPRSITQIAQDCGFSTSQYFAKVFHQFTGMSASAFRSISSPPINRIGFDKFSKIKTSFHRAIR